MGGKLIDRHEMAMLVSLVIDKGVSTHNAVKKFDFKVSAATKFVRAARDGEFDYKKYLPADTESPPVNESEDRSIFAVAEMIDYAVSQALQDKMVEVDARIEAMTAKQRGFEESVQNKIQGIENRVNRFNRGQNSI